MILRALSSSPVRRSLSRRSLPISLSRGVSAAGRPDGLASSTMPPLLCCSRHSESSDEYRPSWRSRAPLSALPRRSYSSRILALYAAGNRRVGRARLGTTSGSGSVWSITRSWGARDGGVVDRCGHRGNSLPALSGQCFGSPICLSHC